MSAVEQSEHWFQLPDDPYFNSPKGTMIRAWKPGDGLACSYRDRRSSVSCGAPVAVLNVSGSEIGRSVRRTRIACSIHAADAVRQLMRDQRSIVTLKTDAQRVAREQVIANHWDEYQEAINHAIEAEKSKAFDWLPDALKKAILANEETECE